MSDSDKDFSNLIPGADRPRGRRASRRTDQSADSVRQTTSENASQDQNTEADPAEVSTSERTEQDTDRDREVGASEARARNRSTPSGSQHVDQEAAVSERERRTPEDSESHLGGARESVANGTGSGSAASERSAAVGGESITAPASSRELPEGKNSPMANRTEDVIPSHYTLPESHTIVVDEIRAILRRPPYRYTKRQASQSNVVALAIERLYEDVTGEAMPQYGSEHESR